MSVAEPSQNSTDTVIGNADIMAQSLRIPRPLKKKRCETEKIPGGQEVNMSKVYTGGFPSFGIEKPMSLPWHGGTGLVKDLQDSGGYSAELKLNEHRGFITIDKKGKATFFSYRGPSANSGIVGSVMNDIEQMGIPPNTVFDGGQFFRKELGGSRLWLFDVLVWEGEKVRLPWKERRELLDSAIEDNHKTVWTPPLCWRFHKEFGDMLKGKSKMVSDFLVSHHLPPSFGDQIEGLVIKRLDGKLSFPVNKKEVPTFFKLRLADTKTK